jgi:hypothetical protein
VNGITFHVESLESMGVKLGMAPRNWRSVENPDECRVFTACHSGVIVGFNTSSDLADLQRELVLERELARLNPWQPLPGPQRQAYESEADIVGYGGAAGGGKTDLAIGKALTQHRKVAMFRREGTELGGIVDRLAEVLGSREGYTNGREHVWRVPGGKVQIEFGSVPHAGDEKKHQGRPKDLLVIDEAANFLESQVRFLMGWVRTVDPNQRCQVLMTFNPPTSSDGRWLVAYFAPWLDTKHPIPAQPGELRWFAVVDGIDIEVISGEPFMHKGELIKPQSRTFIPSRVADNPYLMGTNYMAQLQALPEPLRSQMLYGDFTSSMQDDPWQVIPTAWVEAAMARWKPMPIKALMDSIGVDVARGGKDNTIIARRHGNWFDEPLAYAGTQTPDGPAVAAMTTIAIRDNAPVHIDVIGVGASPYDFLRTNGIHVLGVNVAEKSSGLDSSGALRFFNLRSELWWKFREALDPVHNRGIALPLDRQLLADLCAPKWSPQGSVVRVEGRDDILKRLGRSPDWASAYVLALMDTPAIRSNKKRDVPSRAKRAQGHDPFELMRNRA